MNILGIGPAELIVILVIMFVVAGPKRMLAWAYVLGQYVAKFRAYFDETMRAVRKEFEEAQIDLPKNMPLVPGKRFDILQEANKLINAELNKAPEPNSAAPTAPEPPATPAAQDTPPEVDTKPDDEKSRYDSWLPK
jgi:Sec-independent protein translocase protein TatA